MIDASPIPAQGASESTLEEIAAARRSCAVASAHWQAAGPELAEVLLLERLVWLTLDRIALLALRAKRVVPEVVLPPPLLSLRPRGAFPGLEWLEGRTPTFAPDQDEGPEGCGGGGEYPPLRRAQRLAFALATVLEHSFPHADGRQVGHSAS